MPDPLTRIEPSTPGSLGTPGALVTLGVLVTLGEILGTVSVGSPGALRVGSAARLSIAGAEGNVAIAAARLGADARWIGRVGDDDIGRLITSTLRGEGVGIGGLRVEPQRATGLLIKFPRTADETRVGYYRRGLAGSALAPADVDEATIASARVLHVTGITPALGQGPAATVTRAVEIARANGVIVSFDVNYRSKLWNRAEASPVLTRLAAASDLVFGGADELALVASGSELAGARELLGLGVGQVVIKDGARGARLVDARGVTPIEPVKVTAVDPVGAGDAFVGGYLSGLLEGLGAVDCARRGALVGAIAVSTIGDWEGLPTRAELDSRGAIRDDVAR